MITKIDIPNFGLYKDYSWDQSIGRNETFRKLNIIYGRNYSGKTTLSRIFKCIEDRNLHRNYSSCSFNVAFADGVVLSSTNFETDFSIRVYNTDFVRDNLSWLHNDDGSIKPFTILGAKNVDLERQLEEIAERLGSVEESRGILFSLSEKKQEFDDAKEAHSTKYNDLDDKLRKRANDKIKVTPHLFIPTKQKKAYTIADIKADVESIRSNLATYILTETEVDGLKAVLGDTPLVNIELLREAKPNFPLYYESVRDLLQKNIKPNTAIAELLEDHLLQEWVRQGIDKHKGKKETCAFCGAKIPLHLWGKLDEHFSKESEDLRGEIETKIEELESAKKKLDNFFALSKQQFYSSLQLGFDDVDGTWQEVVKSYKSSLNKLIDNLVKRREDIFTTVQLDDVTDYSEDVLSAIKEFNKLIGLNNDKTVSLEADQTDAREKLRKSDIAQYLNDIEYHSRCKEIENEESNVKRAETFLNPLKNEVETLLAQKDILEAQAKDESKGAELVNQHLSHFFGHRDLRLVAFDQELGVKFKIQRGGVDANNLSEGESSLISFCYFIAKIEDELQDEMKHNKLIIYIDDPISSLDSNHIFFMYSLVESVIAKPKKYAQLFISTHNLEFLKYLRKLTIPKYNPGNGNGKKPDIKYLLVERKNSELTVLKLAPDYLKNYVTEFNYLFEQIFNCSIGDEETISHAYQYNFGNNMRKFLEAYLYYKYPSHTLSNDDRIRKYFENDTVTVNLVNRVTNEYSHLEDKFDRSLEPIDISEIQQIADLVLKKMKNSDPDQFDALLESIGQTPLGTDEQIAAAG